MSSSYTTEPATRGQLILHTTKGPIDIVLWPKEAPLATRNLIQLALDGYYDGCIFHRLIPGFILQGGDPTGTGHGGESSTGAKLPVETHQRLKFNRRGLVALADGFSQFFITLDKTPELDGKHTLMGKVVGDTLFNVLDMANAPVDANERPTNPVRIERVEVVDNPFEDVVPRANVAARAVNARLAAKADRGEKSVGGVLAKKPTKRTRALLSFGGDEDEDGAGGMEAHKKAKKEPKKVMMSAIDAEEQLTAAGTEAPSSTGETAAPASPAAPNAPKAPSTERLAAPAPPSPPPRTSFPPPPPPASSIASRPAAATAFSSPFSSPSTSASQPKPKSKPSVPLWQQERDKYLAASRRTTSTASTSDSAILDKLAAFKSKLATTRDDDADSGSDTDAAAADQPPCLLHSVPGCLSCSASFGVGLGNVSDKGWMAHKLKFAKDRLGKDVTKGKVLEDEMYMVIDPRDELRKGKDKEGGGGAKKGGGQSWREGGGGRGLGGSSSAGSWKR